MLVQVVLALLEHDASVTVLDVQGNTPLHFSCTNGHYDSAITLLFVSQYLLVWLTVSVNDSMVLM